MQFQIWIYKLQGLYFGYMFLPKFYPILATIVLLIHIFYFVLIRAFALYLRLRVFPEIIQILTCTGQQNPIYKEII